MFYINHYMPKLGTSSAGCSCFRSSITEALAEIGHSLAHMAKEDRIVIERVEDKEGRDAHA